MIDTQALRELAEHVSWEGPGLGAGALLDEAADALDAMQWRKEPPDSEGWWCYKRSKRHAFHVWWVDKNRRDGEWRIDLIHRQGDFEGGLWLKLPDPEGT